MDFHTGLFCVAYGRDMSSPHVRGEYDIRVRAPWRFGGSSPRAWGIRIASQKAPEPARFIPTCVGNTRQQRTQTKYKLVHPHVRGEYCP